jgi:hypothetical protein
MTSSELIPEAVLNRKAVVYVRQSTQSQVMTNLEGQRRQYDLVELARQRGFVDVEIIDDDLGRSASGTVARPGFDRLVAWRHITSLMSRARLCGGDGVTTARAGRARIPPPHNISCLSCGRGIPLRRHAGGAQCSSSIFRIGGCSSASAVARSAPRWNASPVTSRHSATSEHPLRFIWTGSRGLAGSLLNIAVLGRSAKVLSTDISAPSPPTRLGLERCQHFNTRGEWRPNDSLLPHPV